MPSESFRRRQERQKAEREAARREAALEAKREHERERVREEEREAARERERKEAARAEAEAQRRAEEKKTARRAAARARRRAEVDAHRREQARAERRDEAARRAARAQERARQQATERTEQQRDSDRGEARDEQRAQHHADERDEQRREAARAQARDEQRTQQHAGERDEQRREAARAQAGDEQRREAARAQSRDEQRAQQQADQRRDSARNETRDEQRAQQQAGQRRDSARSETRDEQQAGERAEQRREAARAQARDEQRAQKQAGERAEQRREAARAQARAAQRERERSEATRDDAAAMRRQAESEQEAAEARRAAALQTRRQADRERARADDRRAAARRGSRTRGVGTTTGGVATLTSGAGSGRLRVDGRRVVDAFGAAVVLRGVTVRGLERARPQGDVFAPVLAASEAQTLAEWGATAVTIPIAQDLALVGHGDAWADDYLSALDASVSAATGAGMRAIVQLALVSSELTSGSPQLAAPVPDAQSIDMWAQVARRYADEPGVLFDLFANPRDPRPADWTALVMPKLTWQIWERWVLAILGEIKRVNPGALAIVRGIGGRDLSGFPLYYGDGTRIPHVVYAGELAGEPTAPLAALRRLARRAPVAASPWNPGEPMNSSVVETLGRRLADLGAHWMTAGWTEPEAPLAVVAKDRLVPTPLGRAVQVALAQPGPASALWARRIAGRDSPLVRGDVMRAVPPPAAALGEADDLVPTLALGHSCRPGEGPPAPEPDPKGLGPHPLIDRGATAARSRRPSVGYAQQCLNEFLARNRAGSHTCPATSPEALGFVTTAINSLSAGGNIPLEVDCRFGVPMELATKAFQACVGVTRDGQIGPVTWPLLEAFAPPCKPPALPASGPHVPTVDPAAPNHRRWFIGSRDVWADTDVETFDRAPDLWARMASDMAATTGESQGFIYIVGLDLGLDTPMDATGTTLKSILTAADTRKVSVRAMLQSSFPDAAATVKTIDDLPLGSAILDDKRAGAHHQKIVVIKRADRIVAYCGGTDIQGQRIPWHDMHARLTGPAVKDLHLTFVQRWRDHPDSPSKEAVESPMAQSAGMSETLVQVTRTFPRRPLNAGPGKVGYDFAPQGEFTIYEALAHAISQTREFIYLEDQYLTGNRAMAIGPAFSSLLAAKLKDESFKLLVILIARTECLNFNHELGDQGWHRRREFIRELREAAADKVIVCQYKIQDRTVAVSYDTPRFVHSKTWVFDDEFTCFGSANCNAGGYTLNSEANIGVADPNSSADRASFAHRLRIDLWLKHLNPEGASNAVFQEKDVADPISASAHWRCPHPQSPIEPYAVNGQVHAPSFEQDTITTNLDANWDAVDPDGSKAV